MKPVQQCRVETLTAPPPFISSISGQLSSKNANWKHTCLQKWCLGQTPALQQTEEGRGKLLHRRWPQLKTHTQPLLWYSRLTHRWSLFPALGHYCNMIDRLEFDGEMKTLG